MKSCPPTRLSEDKEELLLLELAWCPTVPVLDLHLLLVVASLLRRRRGPELVHGLLLKVCQYLRLCYVAFLEV